MVDTKKIKIIIRKEWAEVFKNRMVIFSVLFRPLLFTAIPLIFLFTMRSTGSTDNLTGDMPYQFTAFCKPGLNGGECFQIYMVSQFILLYMIVPLIIPVN